MVIDKDISSDEILVRYVFLDDFKAKNAIKEKIITKNLLGPLRGGTSLQREKYCDENKCTELGNKIPNKTLVGFLLFNKNDFEKVKKEFIESNENSGTGVILDAYLKATPMDENFKELDFKESIITVNTKGNPAHADLIYLKPILIPEDTEVYEKPNTTIRSFSKKMYVYSNLVFNESEDLTLYSGIKFQEFY